MKEAITILMAWILFVYFLAIIGTVLTGCVSQRTFKIGNGLSAEVIKIEPNKGPKSVYRVERNV